jgi:hypothetical protein
MMTPLDKTIRRSLTINGLDYVLSFSPEFLKITRKGRRLGLELKWQDLTSGDSALAVALHASIGQFDDKTSSSGTSSKAGSRKPRPPPVPGTTRASRAVVRPAARKRSGKRA